MTKIKTFQLPDLGEGLPDATIVEWHAKVGDDIKLDAPLCSMETAKAVVEVPSPYTGKIMKLHGIAGNVIETGAALAEFEPNPNARQRAESESTSHGHGPKKKARKPGPDGGKETASPDKDGTAVETSATREDEGTVVGAMASSNHVHVEPVAAIGNVKAVPAVRALAKKLGVDLHRVTPTGRDRMVTLRDVKQAAAQGSATADSTAAQPAPDPVARSRTVVSQAGHPMRTAPPGKAASGQPEQLKGARRNMARVMADAHARVVPTTVFDDADLHAWIGKQDVTARLVRSIVVACKAIPVLNAWFDDKDLSCTRHTHVDIGIAVDTENGLFVPALRNADVLDAPGIRAAVRRLRDQVEQRTIPSSELSGYTISLSNFGMFAGRHATPVVVPPTVAIIGAGRLSHDVIAVMGGIEVHRRMPISLTFDHRAATGGDAGRFLVALLEDLQLPE